MDISSTQAIIAIILATVALALFVGYRTYLAFNSERRMLTMLGSLGLDADIASSPDFKGVIGEVRQRCRSFTAEDVCERWLRGDEEGDNAFCPNARVFEALKEYRTAAE
jgi:hypothetical protein